MNSQSAAENPGASWQEQELQDEYEFLKMQLKDSDPVVLKEKIEALAVRLGIS